jgi:hypothetical protein
MPVMRDNEEENNNYVVFINEIYTDQLGNRVVVRLEGVTSDI